MEHDERIAKLEAILDGHAAELVQLRQETLQRFVWLEDRIERGFAEQREYIDKCIAEQRAYTDKLREHCDKNFAELRTGQRWTIGLLIATFAGLATMILNIT